MLKACNIVSALDQAGAFQAPARPAETAPDESVQDNRYVGYTQDRHGMTPLGRIVLDGWLFGCIPEDEDCAGWDMARMEKLMDRVQDEWDKVGSLPSRLPDDLRQRHAELYARAMALARSKGWDPELDEAD